MEEPSGTVTRSDPGGGRCLCFCRRCCGCLGTYSCGSKQLFREEPRQRAVSGCIQVPVAGEDPLVVAGEELRGAREPQFVTSADLCDRSLELRLRLFPGGPGSFDGRHEVDDDKSDSELVTPAGEVGEDCVHVPLDGVEDAVVENRFGDAEDGSVDVPWV